MPRAAVDEPRAWAPVIRRGSVTAWLTPPRERGHIQLEFSAWPDEETLVVAALDGLGPHVGDWTARVAQLALATVLREPSYGAYLDPPAPPVATPAYDFPAWTAWLLRGSPALPAEIGALAAALGTRIGTVVEALSLRGLGMIATGAIAVIRGGEAAIVHRGFGKVLRARSGELETLLAPDVLGQSPEHRRAVAETPELAMHDWIAISGFQTGDAPGEPLRIALVPGDRLVFCAGKPILQALDADPALEALLAEDPGRVVARATPELAEQGYGIVAIDIS
jgi:hypothetical protein